MITNEAELAVSLRALRNLEDALASLHRDVWPKNPQMYGLLSEAPIDLLRSIRAEVDAYLGVAPEPAPASVGPAATEPVAQAK